VNFVGGRFEDSEKMIICHVSCPCFGINASPSNVASIPATIKLREWLKIRLEIRPHRPVWMAKRSRHGQ